MAPMDTPETCPPKQNEKRKKNTYLQGFTNLTKGSSLLFLVDQPIYQSNKERMNTGNHDTDDRSSVEKKKERAPCCSEAALLIDRTPCADYRKQFELSASSRSTRECLNVSAIAKANGKDQQSSLWCVQGGPSSPLQPSCLENAFGRKNRNQSTTAQNAVEYFVNVDDAVPGGVNVSDSDLESTDRSMADESDSGLFLDLESIDLDDSDDEKYKPLEVSKPLHPEFYIQDFRSLQASIEGKLECPWCRSKFHKNIYGSRIQSFNMLEVSVQTYGLASELVIQCAKCGFKIEANHRDTKWDYNGRSKFLKYGINYWCILLMQQLGMGVNGLGTFMGMLGLAAGTGNDNKWKEIQSQVGKAQEHVCDTVIEENIEEEVRHTKEEAHKEYATWLLSTEGRAADATTKANKKANLLRIKGNKWGITVGMDGA
jgi:hypothetical protein